ncbi:MAG: Fpg/Nei family DNA glycosylase [Verrucomicrobiae bacterium]|nr:Fpg/Nei family DNA glycosylase [Verrucomicrobiae bacterium]
MPELAEVAYFCKRWNPGLNLRIERVTCHPWARLFRGCDVEKLVLGLTGTKLVASETHGKQMLFRSDAEGWLGIHLGMTGELSFCERPDYDKRYAHLVLQVETGFLVFEDFRQFGRVRFNAGQDPPDWWSNLPIQVVDRRFSLSHFEGLINRRKNSPLKPLLLLQELFPGIGNWMADEILWRARLAPGRKVNSLSQVERKALFDQCRWVTRKALEVVGDDWGDFPDSWLFNHRWQNGGTCPKTKKPLKRETIGGRTTCWSPAWQK